MTERNLFAQQESNKRKSAWLVAGFVLFFAWLGFGGDWAFYLGTRDLPPASYHHIIPFIGLATCLFAGGVAWYSWRNGPRRVLQASGAQELVEAATPELQRLDNVVEEMAIAAGLPKPKIWIIPEDDPNAFATGQDPATASIAVTEGLLKRLNRDELQGVIAHEMSHIRNFDIRLMTLLAAMVGAIALMSDVARQFLRGGGGRRMGGRKGKGAAPVALVVLVLWILSLILAPIVSAILQMGVSRKREYLADASGAQLTRNPMALATALRKLDAETGATRGIMRGSAHLCIVDPAERPLAQKEGFVGGLFSSHPPIRVRIARLQGMAYLAEKTAAAGAAAETA